MLYVLRIISRTKKILPRAHGVRDILKCGTDLSRYNHWQPAGSLLRCLAAVRRVRIVQALQKFSFLVWVDLSVVGVQTCDPLHNTCTHYHCVITTSPSLCLIIVEAPNTFVFFRGRAVFARTLRRLQDNHKECLCSQESLSLSLSFFS